MSFRSYLSASKVLFGINPKQAGNKQDAKKFIPDGYKAVCLISADLEMAWAFLHSRKSKTDKDRAVRLGLQTRTNVLKILDLCDTYNVPLTWATVGHLFLDSCSNEKGLKHENLPRIPFFKNEFWEYDKGDWFEDDPCTDIKTNPEFYGSDLIDKIISRKTKHEIACHTFSHIDCSDERCPNEVFKAEIKECLTLAESKGIALKSFVHPGHQIGHLNDLCQLGFESYRTNYGDTIGFPVKHKSGLWELKNTAEMVYRQDWSDKFNLFKFRKIIDRSIKLQRVMVFWFHPSFEEESLGKVFAPVLRYLDEHRKDVWITTHAEYTNFLNKRNQA